MGKILMKHLKRYKKLVYGLRWSPEIEVEFSEKVDIEVLYERYRKLLGSWTVTHDYSLNNGLEFKPKSYNHLHYSNECFAEVSEVLHIIRKHGGKINSKTCGGHIHIDATKFTDEEILKIIKELISRQKYILQDFKVAKTRLDQTCCPIKRSDIKNLKPADIQNLRNGIVNKDIPVLRNKYYILNLLNLKNFNSLEFRLFQGTLSIRELKNIVKFLLEFLITALEKE